MSGRKKFKILPRLLDSIALAWFLISFFFLFNLESSFAPLEIFPKESFSLFLPKDLLIEDSWYGVYFKEDFIGYSHFYMEALNIKEGKGYLLKNNTSLSLPLLGTSQRININIQTRLSEGYSLKNFKLNLKAGNYFLREELKQVSSDRFLFSLTTPARKEKKEILSKKIPTSLILPFYFNYLPLKKKINIPLFEPLLDKDILLKIENKGRFSLQLKDKTISSYKLELELAGSEAEVFVDEKGKLLKAKFLGWEFLKEEPSSVFANLSFSKGADLIKAFSIPSSLIPNKENLPFLRVRIKGLPADFNLSELNFYNQKAIKKDKDLLLTIKKTVPDKILNLPLEEEVLKSLDIKEEYLREPCSEIRKLAHSIAGEEKDPLKILKKLFSWIDKNIKRVPTFSLFESRDVLKLKQGDCTELSLLLVSFLRSLGMPSYLNIGLVYEGGKFFYHAWVSVFVGSWIDTDVALSQIIADSTHIKLFRGLDNPLKLLSFLGKIRIEVIEADYD